GIRELQSLSRRCRLALLDTARRRAGTAVVPALRVPRPIIDRLARQRRRGRWRTPMLGALLVRIRIAEQLRLRERPAEELQSHRQRVTREPGRDGERRESDRRTQTAVVAESVAVLGARIREHVGGDRL